MLFFVVVLIGLHCGIELLLTLIKFMFHKASANSIAFDFRFSMKISQTYLQNYGIIIYYAE